MNWIKSESTELPLEEDTTSSNKYNYVRRNIKTRQDEDTTIYEYEELKILKEYWDLYKQSVLIQAALDWLIMEG